MSVANYILYKGIPLQQNPSYEAVFKDFLLKQNFTHILEIGTGEGGFTLFLRDTLPNVKILSYDLVYRAAHESLKQANIDVHIAQAFDKNIDNTDWDICYKQIDVNTVNASPVPELVDSFAKQFLAEPGKKLILCDGGHKVGEFNCLARYLNRSDFIMAHDYAYTYDQFTTSIKDKFWDWCEIEEKYISKSSEENNLVFYNQLVFETVAWVCKTRLA